ATLEDLPALAAAAGIGPPATLVVGEVAALADKLAGGWLDRGERLADALDALDTGSGPPAR
ncbi:MAG TPA: hypothetical protein VE776_04160, partial [Actinomycetota bacterium]|nr:hypothetical protein [Actinomycetota bacterium]